jgi:hypothetical protein
MKKPIAALLVALAALTGLGALVPAPAGAVKVISCSSDYFCNIIEDSLAGDSHFADNHGGSKTFVPICDETGCPTGADSLDEWMKDLEGQIKNADMANRCQIGLDECVVWCLWNIDVCLDNANKQKERDDAEMAWLTEAGARDKVECAINPGFPGCAAICGETPGLCPNRGNSKKWLSRKRKHPWEFKKGRH